MSLERGLDRIDRRIQDAREAIETAYATRVPDERKDALLEQLDALFDERRRLRRCWSNAVAWQGIRVAFAEFGRKIREIVARFLPEFERLENERKRSRPAFWRGVADRGARFEVPGRVAFSTALPANRRPVLPGHMKQKGRG